MDCLFCNIASKEIDAEILYEDVDVVAFRDIHPQAKHHILIIPRRHIATINDAATHRHHQRCGGRRRRTFAQQRTNHEAGTIHCERALLIEVVNPLFLVPRHSPLGPGLVGALLRERTLRDLVPNPW